LFDAPELSALWNEFGTGTSPRVEPVQKYENPTKIDNAPKHKHSALSTGIGLRANIENKTKNVKLRERADVKCKPLICEAEPLGA
jgi:hypothetical protein